MLDSWDWGQIGGHAIIGAGLCKDDIGTCVRSNFRTYNKNKIMKF